MILITGKEKDNFRKHLEEIAYNQQEIAKSGAKLAASQEGIFYLSIAVGLIATGLIIRFVFR